MTDTPPNPPTTSPTAPDDTPADTPATDTGRVAADGEWRQQAERAQARVEELRRQLAESQRVLEQTRESLDAAERRRQIERLLADADAIDLETATLLTEAAVAGMDEPDAAVAVADLKRRKPFLFRAPGTRGSTMSPVPDEASEADEAARIARETGDRRALLSYLRLKRTA
jgi:hypothetical protein